MTLFNCELQDQVTNLTKKYSNDILFNLYRQLLAFRTCAGAFNQKAKDLQDILNVIMSLEMSVFPRHGHCVHDILTLLVTVASNERSFSKLKLLKTYLQGTMSHE